jgi:hypothetical protein
MIGWIAASFTGSPDKLSVSKDILRSAQMAMKPAEYKARQAIRLDATNSWRKR